MLTFRYFSGAVQDRADDHNGITLRHRLGAAACMEETLRVIKVLVAELDARKQAP